MATLGAGQHTNEQEAQTTSTGCRWPWSIVLEQNLIAKPPTGW